MHTPVLFLFRIEPGYFFANSVPMARRDSGDGRYRSLFQTLQSRLSDYYPLLFLPWGPHAIMIKVRVAGK